MLITWLFFKPCSALNCLVLDKLWFKEHKLKIAGTWIISLGTARSDLFTLTKPLWSLWLLCLRAYRNYTGKRKPRLGRLGLKTPSSARATDNKGAQAAMWRQLHQTLSIQCHSNRTKLVLRLCLHHHQWHNPVLGGNRRLQMAKQDYSQGYSQDQLKGSEFC